MKDLNIASDFNLVDSVTVSVPWMHLEQCRLNNADNYQDSVEHLIVIQTDTQHRLRLEWSRYMVIQLLEAKGSFWKHNYTIEITNIIAPLIQSRWVLHQIVCCILICLNFEISIRFSVTSRHWSKTHLMHYNPNSSYRVTLYNKL